MVPGFRDRDSAAIFDPFDPAYLESMRGQCRPDHAGEMRAPLAPIQTGPTEGSMALTYNPEANTKPGQMLRPDRGQLAAILGQHDIATFNHCIGNADSKAPRQVVIASPRGAQCITAPPVRLVAHGTCFGNRHDALQHPPDQGRGEPVVAMPALPFHRDQAGIGQFAEVRAGRLRRDPCEIGEFGRGKRATVHKSGEDIGAGRIADKGGNVGYVWAGLHLRILALITCERQQKQFERGRSDRG